MMTAPGDEVAAAVGRPGYLRASHTDRERAIDTVKDAFVRGQLTMAELDARVGQVLAARTHDDLAAVIVGIPAGSDLPWPPRPARAQPRPPGNRLVNPGVCVIVATTLAAGVWAGMVAGVAAAVIVAIFMLNLTALATRPLPWSSQRAWSRRASGPRPARARPRRPASQGNRQGASLAQRSGATSSVVHDTP